MASIRTETLIDATPDAVWDALRDWGALHARLVPGFVTDTQVDGRDRLVTFFNGAVARERRVSADDEQRRLVWTVVESPLGYEHHNASAQALDGGDGRTRFVWIADVLPDTLEPEARQLMEHGTEVIGKTLSAAGARAA